MAELVKPIAIGDVVLSEAPRHYCRCDHSVSRVLAATEGLVAGQAMDFDAAVAAVQTITMGTASASGTYRLGYKGRWTAPIAYDEVLANIKTAFELISGGVTVTFSAAFVTGTTITFDVADGNVEDIQYDGRLNLTVGGVEATATILTTTAGELATYKMVAATSADADSILLEGVSLELLQNGSEEELRRSFLTRGPSTVNADAVTIVAGTRASLVTALEALGIQCHRQSTMTDEGIPRS